MENGNLFGANKYIKNSNKWTTLVIPLNQIYQFNIYTMFLSDGDPGELIIHCVEENGLL